MNNPMGASSLQTLNLPNGINIRSALERIDQLFAIYNGQNNATGYDTAIQALGSTAAINNVSDLLAEIVNQLNAAKQSVTNIQNYAQNQLSQLSQAITNNNNPAIAAGAIDIHDTVAQALQKLGDITSALEEALPKVSTAQDNQLQLVADGLFVKEYIFPVSAVAGNALSQKPDGYYVNQSTNGMSTEQLMEMLVNAGLNADANSSLAIKLKPLIQSYQ